MEVVSVCPLRAGSVLWETASGALTLTVVAKATYLLRPSESPLATLQDAPTEADEHWDDDERRSLLAPSDLVPFKRRADVILVGHAFAPGGVAVRSLLTRLVVGEVDKSIEVFGERVFTSGGALREGARFVKMPLRWERAAGGPDTQNPVGVRLDGPRDAYGALALPNLQPPGLHITSPGDFIPPVGFGPHAPSWPARIARLSIGAAGWNYRRWSERALPPDLDAAFFNVAPIDQQLDALRPNPRLVLDNLHPEHPELVTSLATVTPRVVVERAGASQEFGMRCDTLLIDTDRGTCSLTWRGQIPMDDPLASGRVIITTTRLWGRPEETARARRAAATVDLPPPAPSTRAPIPAPPPVERVVERTIDGPSSAAMPPLPFRVGRSPLTGSVLGALTPPRSAPIVETPAPAVDLSWGDTADEQTAPTGDGPASAPLPFARIPQGLDDDEEETHTELPRNLAELVWPPVAAPPPPPPLDESEGPGQTIELKPARRAPPPIEDAAPAPPRVEPAVVSAPPIVPPPAPPPMIGPLATLDMGAPSSQPEPARAAAPRPLLATPTPPAPLPLDAYPLERCAAIAASIARTRSAADRILAEHELGPDLWQRLDRHWADHVRAAGGRGRSAPLKAYDTAYVAQLEKERGVLRADEYARLVVAVERGAADEELEALHLPRGALLRVQRVWLGRTASDTELGKAVRAAVDAARDA